MPATRSLLTTGWAAAALIGVVLFANNCGRKLPPIQPGVLPPPTVTDLTHEVRESEILLFWSQPAVNPAKESAAAGFKVLRMRQTKAEAECRTCPMPFQVIADITASGRKSGSRFRFQDRLEPGYLHSYKVQAYTADGVAGKDSNAAAVSY
jgi:hypothetical protein